MPIIILFHYFIFTDDVERPTSADPQDAAAEDPPVAHETETEAEVSEPRHTPSPSKDVQQEEAEAQGEQQKEDESN